MSQLSLRRYRAERLLREEFERLRASVISVVRTRLRGVGVVLDASDLEACYAQAWQGLFTAMIDGERVANTTGWLVLVTYRRAIDEHRAYARLQGGEEQGRLAEGEDGPRDHTASRSRAPRLASEPDVAAELDDRATLRALFEALRGRLSAREQQAATLCYLQGLSRSEAAARMGVSEARMRKLMEGRGASSPGVAGKVGALVETIRAGAWCEEQGSLMRGFAFGILDPAGERYRLAIAHRSECPACRAYVLSLRGLAAILPPVPSLVHLTLAAGAGSGAAAGAGAGGAPGAAAPVAPGVGGAGVSASGAAGTSAMGGGWLLAGGPLGAKLAVGCLLIAGVGASCAALDVNTGAAHLPSRRRHAPSARTSSATAPADSAERRLTIAPLAYPADGRAASTGGEAARRAPAVSKSRVDAAPRTAAARASREFGPEQDDSGGEAGPGASGYTSSAPSASVASNGGDAAVAEVARSAASASSASSAGDVRHGVAAAQREFAPG